MYLTLFDGVFGGVSHCIVWFISWYLIVRLTVFDCVFDNVFDGEFNWGFFQMRPQTVRIVKKQTLEALKEVGYNDRETSAVT